MAGKRDKPEEIVAKLRQVEEKWLGKFEQRGLVL